jgi:hypothetical protein
MAFLRSKLTHIVLATVVIGCLGGLLAARSIMPPSASPAGAAQLVAHNGSSTGEPDSTATAGSSSPTPTVARSAPTATPTRVPPTPTPIPVPGQSLTVRGDVTSIDATASTFVVHVFGGGGTYTCNVGPSTTWSGVATSLATLRVGMGADASGTYQGGGVLNPTAHVDADY